MTTGIPLYRFRLSSRGGTPHLSPVTYSACAHSTFLNHSLNSRFTSFTQRVAMRAFQSLCDNKITLFTMGLWIIQLKMNCYILWLWLIIMVKERKNGKKNNDLIDKYLAYGVSYHRYLGRMRSWARRPGGRGGWELPGSQKPAEDSKFVSSFGFTSSCLVY